MQIYGLPALPGRPLHPLARGFSVPSGWDLWGRVRATREFILKSPISRESSSRAICLVDYVARSDIMIVDLDLFATASISPKYNFSVDVVGTLHCPMLYGELSTSRLLDSIMSSSSGGGGDSALWAVAGTKCQCPTLVSQYSRCCCVSTTKRSDICALLPTGHLLLLF